MGCISERCASAEARIGEREGIGLGEGGYRQGLGLVMAALIIRIWLQGAQSHFRLCTAYHLKRLRGDITKH